MSLSICNITLHSTNTCPTKTSQEHASIKPIEGRLTSLTLSTVCFLPQYRMCHIGLLKCRCLCTE